MICPTSSCLIPNNAWVYVGWILGPKSRASHGFVLHLLRFLDRNESIADDNGIDRICISFHVIGFWTALFLVDR